MADDALGVLVTLPETEDKDKRNLKNVERQCNRNCILMAEEMKANVTKER